MCRKIMLMIVVCFTLTACTQRNVRVATISHKITPTEEVKQETVIEEKSFMFSDKAYKLISKYIN